MFVISKSIACIPNLPHSLSQFVTVVTCQFLYTPKKTKLCICHRRYWCTHLCHPSVEVGEFLLLYCTAELWVSGWLGTAHSKELGPVLCWQLGVRVCIKTTGPGHFTASLQVSAPAFLCHALRQVVGSRQMQGFVKGQVAASLWSVSTSTVRS